MNPKAKPDLLDDDSPEADAGWFARAKPAAELLPDVFGADVAAEMLTSDRGRQDLASRKEQVTIALDVDVVGAFRATGRGWQARLNNALRDWLRERTPTA